MKTALWYLLLVLFMVYVLRQVRRPTRWVGRIFVHVMNISHGSLSNWALQHVMVRKEFAILDVGCGGGKTIRKLAELATEGSVHGIDYSKGSVGAARATNARLIEAGRVEIREASVSALPFGNGTFDLVTAIETQYYWPDLLADTREVRRVLKAGGHFLIAAETYKGGRYDWLKAPVMKLLKSSHLSADDQRKLFASAGFDRIEVFEERNKGWICVVGTNGEGAE